MQTMSIHGLSKFAYYIIEHSVIKSYPINRDDCRANVIENKTVCCMPLKSDLCDPSAERFINTDASSYLQVRLFQ